MEYHTYNELCDRINELLEENRELTYLIDNIPKDLLRKILKYSSLDLKKKWLKVLQRRVKNEKN